MLRKTLDRMGEAVRGVWASMRPQRNAAENEIIHPFREFHALLQ